MELRVAQAVLRQPLERRRGGTGPPKVLDAPNPTSSSRISRTLGAPFGACTGFGKSGTESFTLSPIWPLKGTAAAGSTSCE